MMQQRQKCVLIYSKDLAELKEEFQKEAVGQLQKYVREKKGIWEYQEGERMAQAFEEVLSGDIMLLKKIADANQIPFQPEVIRGELSPDEIRDVEKMGFQALCY